MRNSKSSGARQAGEAAHDEVAAVARDREVGDDRRSARSPPPRPRCAWPAPRRARRSPARGSRRGRDADRGGGASRPEHGLLDRVDLGLARHHRAGVAERDLRVLQPVAGEHADDPRRALGAVLAAAPPRPRPRPARRTRPRARPASGRRRGSRASETARMSPCEAVIARHRLLPARRVADPDRARHRLRVLDRRAVDQRRRALGLPAEHPRRRRRPPGSPSSTR